jgi:RimJ/RimL family protein N-acetyltransferase
MKSKQLIITTSKSRILLRPPEMNDVSTIYKLVRDPQVFRYTHVPYPYQRKHAVMYVNIAADGLKKKTGYMFVIVDKETGQLIGALGLHQVSPLHKKAELGYWIGKPFRGFGYATEASRLLIDYGFKKLKLKRIYAYAMTGNTNSRNILKKCGFMKEGLLRDYVKHQGRWRDVYAYAILKREWKR